MEKLKLLEVLDSIAPLSSQEEWDNSGMQIDVSGGEVKKILVALDITNAVIDEALQKGCDLILTHHPLFFEPVRSISSEELSGIYAARLIRAGISVYSSHTPFDAADGGNNDFLMRALGCSSAEPLEGASPARLGRLCKPMSFGELAERLRSLCGGGIKVQGDMSAEISTLALCSGAGGSLVYAACAAGADAYVSGDIKHHEALAAREIGICLADAGHYGTEKHFVRNMASRLRTDGRVSADIEESSFMRDPYDAVL